MRPSSVLLAASGWIALAASALPALSPIRAAVAVLFIAFCPGAAALRLIATVRPVARREPMLTAALTGASSLAMATLVSESFFLAGGFTAQRCVIALSTLTGVLVLLPEFCTRRRRPA